MKRVKLDVSRHVKGLFFLVMIFCLLHGIALAKKPQKMTEIFSADYSTQLILDIEAALARAQAKLGIIPQYAADEINEKADIKYTPQEAVSEERKK